MPRVKMVRAGDRRVPAVQCPACECLHVFDGWEWNGDMESPTFSPSMHVKWGDPLHDLCHSFVRDGCIEFLNDCTHALAGQTVELPEV